MADKARSAAELLSLIPEGHPGNATIQWFRDLVSSLPGVASGAVNLMEARFGAKGDGVTDDSAALTAALLAASGKTLIIPPALPGQFYKVSTSFTPGNNTTIQGSGLAGELRQQTAETRTFNVGSATGVTFFNVAALGQGGFSNAWVDDTHFDIGIYSNAGSDLKVLYCTLRNFALAGVFTTNTPNVLIEGNRIQGTHQLGAVINVGSAHQYGIAVTGLVATQNVRILGNDVSDTAFGIDTSGATTLLDSLIANNNVHDIRGQHALYVGSGKLLVSSNIVTEFVNHGIKVYAGIVDTQRDVTVIGNHISSSVANGFGIVIALSAGGVMTDVLVIGNQIRNMSGTPTTTGLAGGVLVEGTTQAIISQNIIRDVYTAGISVDATQLVTDISIDGNEIIGTSTDGISIAAPAGSSRIRITSNKLSLIPAGFMGIKLSSAVDDVFVEGNTVNGGFNSVYNGGSATNVKIVNNILTGWASAPFPLSPVAVIYENNQDGKEFTTYSANQALFDYDRYVGINATGGVVTITVPTAAGVRGKTITFIKTDASANAVTISCPSVNINGAASQALAAQYNKLTIRSNGVTWFIVA